MFLRRKKQPVPAIPPPIAAPSEPAAPPEDAVPRKKILVIDDDAVILKTLSMTLKSNGYKVVTATDGSQAITVMREERPDMMLVDVSLPPDVSAGGHVTWDGFQITRWLRQVNDHVPTIVISGTNNPDYNQRATAVGAQGFLPKPINSELLLATIASALSSPRQVGVPAKI